MPCEHMRKADNSVRERGTGEMEAVPVFKVLRFTLETRRKRGKAILGSGCIMCKAIEERSKYSS